MTPKTASNINQLICGPNSFCNNLNGPAVPILKAPPPPPVIVPCFLLPEGILGALPFLELGFAGGLPFELDFLVPLGGVGALLLDFLPLVFLFDGGVIDSELLDDLLPIPGKAPPVPVV